MKTIKLTVLPSEAVEALMRTNDPDSETITISDECARNMFQATMSSEHVDDILRVALTTTLACASLVANTGGNLADFIRVLRETLGLLEMSNANAEQAFDAALQWTEEALKKGDC